MSKKNHICRVTTKRLICGDLSVCYAILRFFDYAIAALRMTMFLSC